jgi:Predicted membrane protein (DUF2127)
MDRPARPFGITVIVVLLLVSSAIAIPSGLIGVVGTIEGGVTLEPLPSLRTLQLLGALALLLAVGVVTLVAAIGLLRLRRWAWVLVMLIVGGQLVTNLWEYFVLGERPYLDMLLNVVTVFYLNQREVQRAFGERVARDRLLDAPIQRAR